VDDEVVIAVTLGEILSREGFDVSCFTNPLKALEAAHSHAPDLLIADVVMPELSGIDLAVVVRETWPNCMVLLFSGHPSTSAILQLASENGNNFDVLSKPVPPQEILARVSNALGLDAAPDLSTSASS
jgi:DNA-binding response OmpR family regulator